jgi:hypothetical protein
LIPSAGTRASNSADLNPIKKKKKEKKKGKKGKEKEKDSARVNQ